ncbi:Aldo/keto reductase [Hyaloscypha variabilis F]|uniref:Aldo/keto reductase n=1 Tax=Hyaloscypha variabilis (strain UAMH 11265 / GT02V1 / F) TaxID=1149755 RepID=A0A2J6QT94_HYAVF|nr:Aldo/keto reductase [Hyaloscypha variabilis F]
MAGSPPFPQSLKESLESTRVEYVKLGLSGLNVSWPILGTMSFGSAKSGGPWALDEDTSLEILKAAYDCGINTWDTANSYSNGLSEETIGKAIKNFGIPRQKVVLMTKCAFGVGEEPNVHGFLFGEHFDKSKDYINQFGLSRSAIFTAVENSLARLGTAYIDVLQIHRYDTLTPLEETMKALHDLVQAGKVRYIGASSMWATQFAQLQFIAEKNNWTKFISMQNYYNLCYREEEREMNRFCKDTGVGLMPWSPMHAGRLARPVGADKTARASLTDPYHPNLTPADEEIIGKVEQLANKKGWKMNDVALVWHKSKGTVPIVGLNSVKRVADVCNLRGKSLTDEEVKYLEEPYIARPVAGHF